MVRREDDSRTQPTPERLQPGIAGCPCPRLGGSWTQLQPADVDLESVAGGQRAHLLRHFGAVGVDAVVNVRHHQLQAMRVPAGDQQIEQRHRIRPPGDRDQGPAGTQVQRRQLSPEIVEQGHERSLIALKCPRGLTWFHPPGPPCPVATLWRAA